jgi:hypothetical protein
METSNNQEIKELVDEIKQLRLQVSTMNQTIINLEQKVDNTNDTLINHIGFIDNVFNSIKRPLFFIMNKVNGFLQIEDQTRNEELENNQSS